MPYQTRRRKQDQDKHQEVVPCASAEEPQANSNESTSQARDVTPVQPPTLSPPTQELSQSQPTSSTRSSVQKKKKSRLAAISSEEEDTSTDKESSTSESPPKDSEQSSMDERRRKRKCTMVVDKDDCICYPATGNNAQILAMNGTISVDGTTADGGFIFKFENKNSRMFRKKLFTPDLGDTKSLIKKINAHAENSSIKWLYLRDLDVGDKRANIGLYMHEMSEKYALLPAEDRFEILCASNLGFFVNEESHLFLVSQEIQYDLTTLERLPLDETVFIEDTRVDSVPFKMETVTKVEATLAQHTVNSALFEYFHEPQPLVFCAGILFAFIGPYLRLVRTVPSLPLVVAFGPNNCGKTDRSQVYSATCGVAGGKSKKSTAKGILEMMGESSLTCIPIDDPIKDVLEEVVEYGYDGSDVTKIRGNKTVITKMRRNVFTTCKTADFDQNYHTKMIFTPEEPVEQERLDSKRDLKFTVERLCHTTAPKAVLHNLQFCKLFADTFIAESNPYCK